MKLITGPASPFGRKVRVVAIELGLDARIEIELFPPDQIAARSAPHNPLSKMPALIRDEGGPLFDSPVICEYLDSLHGGTKLFPAQGEAKWNALRLQALGDGIGEAVGALGAEKSRPAPAQHALTIESQSARIAHALDYLEARIDELSGQLNIGQIAVACGLGYVDFLVPALGWQNSRPQLADWFQTFSRRDSMQRTLFRRPATVH